MRKALIFICLLNLCFVLCMVSSCSAPQSYSVYPLITNTEGVATPGKPAPNFSWIGSDNIKHNLTDFAGKPVVIATWDTGCTFCLNVMLPYFKTNYQKYTDQGAVILTINDKDSYKMFADFVKDKDYPFLLLKDENKPEFKFRSPYLIKFGNPWIVLIDKKGILVDIKGIFTDPSAKYTEDDLRKIIDNFVGTQNGAQEN